jgi:hypothetical protein
MIFKNWLFHGAFLEMKNRLFVRLSTQAIKNEGSTLRKVQP